jgi:hypothetical protein
MREIQCQKYKLLQSQCPTTTQNTRISYLPAFHWSQFGIFGSLASPIFQLETKLRAARPPMIGMNKN